jgi:hypothetical protein
MRYIFRRIALAIKVITVGLQSPNSTLNVIQRGGKKIILALVINIGISAENLAKIDPDTPVSFAIEEVPLAAAKKLVAETEGDDIGGLIAIEWSKPLPEGQTRLVKEFVRRSVMSLPVADLKPQLADG